MAATFTPRPICRGFVPPRSADGVGADALRLQELRGEQHVRFLEADRARVGDVVAHDVDVVSAACRPVRAVVMADCKPMVLLLPVVGQAVA